MNQPQIILSRSARTSTKKSTKDRQPDALSAQGPIVKRANVRQPHPHLVIHEGAEEVEVLQGEVLVNELVADDLEGDFYLNINGSDHEIIDLDEQEREASSALTPAKRTRGARERRAEGGTDLAVMDPLQRYLSEVRRYPLLTAAQEEHFSKRYYDLKDNVAGQKLVLSNLRLVVKIAMEYKRAWTDVMDLIQEGSLGLSEAVKRFDPYRGVRFSTFARFWIHAMILQYILKNFSMFSFATTRAGRKLFYQLERERDRLIKMYGRATYKMIAENLNVSEEEVRLIDLLKRPAIELDAPRASGEEEAPPLIETLPSDESTTDTLLVEQDLREVFHKHVVDFGQTLSKPREIRIWRDRITAEEPVSLESIAQEFNVTRERIRQVEEGMKDRFKTHLKESLGSELGVFIEGK